MRGRIHHRTIPTRVGSTSTFHFRCPSDSDHPHVGGEHDLQNGEHVKERGPSPRGWGAPRSVPLSITQPRTIPTRVGSTIIKKCVQGLGTDHPHAGGEHCIKFHPGTRNIGPSPRGWGALWIDRDLRRHLMHFLGLRRAGFRVRPTPRPPAKGRKSQYPDDACHREFGS